MLRLRVQLALGALALAEAWIAWRAWRRLRSLQAENDNLRKLRAEERAGRTAAERMGLMCSAWRGECEVPRCAGGSRGRSAPGNGPFWGH